MKIYKILILIGFLIAGFSCSDDFLEKSPKGEESADQFYKTKRGIDAQIIAAYSELKNYRYASNRFFLGDVASDDATKGSEPGDFVTAKEIEEFRATASNFQFGTWWWTRIYRGIFYANVAISNIDELEDVTESEKNQLLAEARFLRAYYYSELVRSYGGVPLRTAPDQPIDQPRASAEEVYNLIEEDYSFAIQNLPEKSQYPAEDMGRATKGAAQALLGKVYLYQEKWQQAKEAFQKVINSGEYSLDPSYSSMFTVAGENGVESIFEIQFFESESEADTWRNGGNFTTVFIMPRNIWGWGIMQPTQALYDAYESGDPRREATIILRGEVIEGEVQEGSDDQTGLYSRKDFLPPSERPVLNVKNSPLNEIIIRLADVYLMYAEAAYHLGDETTAKMYVNMVRERARNGDNTILPDVTASGTALLDAIYHERRVELGLEHHRYWDVIRTGRGQELLHPNFTPGKHELFPIPQSEIDASKGVLTQNPGY
ncbi:putative outer membrane starch-binding protein [Balneicella halophila]|uniref:Putative outer membrane starch-binding protein n=1 Tax=Balneicella halophila TaxID=1537566 RepID=A0A7L4URC7_BALHA|nr:RagB/SusD family nutrient uptake outer membrane protein [Balneicella halophila]PVX52325.1 putative outer membrane starch-binding protein [Balneicella halophila]